MAWTATFQSVGQHPQTAFALSITVGFTDGVKTVTVTESARAVDDPAFLRAIEGYVASLEKVSATLANPPTPGTLVPKAPVPAPPDPTAEEVARDAWLVLYRDWQLKTKELASGAGTTKPSDVDAALLAWKAAYLPAYAGYLI